MKYIYLIILVWFAIVKVKEIIECLDINKYMEEEDKDSPYSIKELMESGRFSPKSILTCWQIAISIEIFAHIAILLLAIKGFMSMYY